MNHELLFDSYSGPRYGDRIAHQNLFLPALLEKRATDQRLYGPDRDQAFKVIQNWADLEYSGKLAKKTETAVEGEFLHDVFSKALGYTFFSKNESSWNLQPKFSVNGGQADAALGVFEHSREIPPSVVIELKGPTVNLDRDRFNGRTAVQQC
ncbi:MAG TPA: hypothetical protein VMS71_03110 [Candidatus Acidoferrum sp.]|nr:hypothetical protein [Candidatus Acidoferrum sp.]